MRAVWPISKPYDRSAVNEDTTHPAWPELTLAAWEDTRETFHLWTQVVGKVRLALEPMANHWWQVPFYVSALGLTTSLMHEGSIGVEIEFDLVDHVLEIRTTDGRRRHVELRPRSVADFYAAVMRELDDLGLHISVFPSPVEVAEAIPFARDEQHGAYDPVWVHRFWLALVQAHRVMRRFRGASSARRARCTSSGAARTWRCPASRGGPHRSTQAECRTVRIG